MINKEDAIAHVIFDNDGTMVDSEQNFYDSMEDIFTNHLNRTVSLEEIKRVYVPDWVQILINLKVNNPSEELIQAIVDDLNEKNKDYIPPLFPGIIKLIKELHQLNIATYVWTGRDKKSSMQIFESHKMLPLLNNMMFRDTCKAKPSTDGLEIMVGDITKDKLVLIGDSTVDIKGALDFKIPCLIVDWKKSIDHDFFLKEGARKIVQAPTDILNWVKENLI